MISQFRFVIEMESTQHLEAFGKQITSSFSTHSHGSFINHQQMTKLTVLSCFFLPQVNSSRPYVSRPQPKGITHRCHSGDWSSVILLKVKPTDSGSAFSSQRLCQQGNAYSLSERRKRWWFVSPALLLGSSWYPCGICGLASRPRSLSPHVEYVQAMDFSVVPDSSRVLSVISLMKWQSIGKEVSIRWALTLRVIGECSSSRWSSHFIVPSSSRVEVQGMQFLFT